MLQYSVVVVVQLEELWIVVWNLLYGLYFLAIIIMEG